MPLVLRQPGLNEDPEAGEALVAEFKARLEGAPRVVSGSEDWYGSDLPELREKGDAGPLTMIALTRIGACPGRC